jgi:hypothetical protein
MGATTKYHPVSVPLIRNVLAKHDILTDRIHQVSNDFDQQSAIYDITIKEMEGRLDLEGCSPRAIQLDVVHAFDRQLLAHPDDWIANVRDVIWQKKYWIVRIHVRLVVLDADSGQPLYKDYSNA